MSRFSPTKFLVVTVVHYYSETWHKVVQSFPQGNPESQIMTAGSFGDGTATSFPPIMKGAPESRIVTAGSFEDGTAIAPPFLVFEIFPG